MSKEKKNEPSVKSLGQRKKCYPNSGKRAMMVFVKVYMFVPKGAEEGVP